MSDDTIIHVTKHRGAANVIHARDAGVNTTTTTATTTTATTSGASRRRRRRKPAIDDDAFKSITRQLDARNPTRGRTGQNLWDAKPPWCEPWSIITACLVVAPTKVFHATGASARAAVGVSRRRRAPTTRRGFDAGARASA